MLITSSIFFPSFRWHLFLSTMHHQECIYHMAVRLDKHVLPLLPIQFYIHKYPSSCQKKVGFYCSSQAEPIMDLEHRISGLLRAVLSGHSYNPNVVQYPLRSLPGIGRKGFFLLASVKKGIPFPVRKMWLWSGQASRLTSLYMNHSLFFTLLLLIC